MVNAPGLIDSGYRGELRVLLFNTDHEHPFEIEPGDPNVQLLVVAVRCGDAGRGAEFSDISRRRRFRLQRSLRGVRRRRGLQRSRRVRFRRRRAS